MSLIPPWLSVILSIGIFLGSPQTASQALVQRSRDLYEKAINALDRGSESEALRFAKLALEADPNNRQASKLVLILGGTISVAAPPKVGTPAPNGWAFEAGSGRIDSFPDYFHLASGKEGGTPPTLTFGLPFPAATTQWEVEFRERVGLPASGPSIVTINAGNVSLAEVEATPNKVVIRSGGRTWTLAAVTTWRLFRFEWRAGSCELIVDGVSKGRTTLSGIPDRIRVGSTTKGAGAETFFELTEFVYQVPASSVGR